MKLSTTLLYLAILAAIVYSPCLNLDFTNWDDQVYVIENKLIKDDSQGGIKNIIKTPIAANYHPLTIFSLALNYKLSGLEPFSYHLVNLILHILNSFLLLYFIYLITGGKVEVAFITSVLFAIHPMHVESVAWVAARKDVLYSFFFLAGLITYWNWRRKGSGKWWVFTLLLFVLSLASKPAAVVFPLVLIAVDLFAGRKFDFKMLLEKIPFFGLSLVAGLLTISAQDEAGALADIPVHTFFQKILFASHSLLTYIIKAFVPAGLSAFHPYPYEQDISFAYYVSPLLVLGLAATIFFLFRNNRMVVFGSLFFFLNIFLVLQLFSFGNAIMAERYTYLPYIGLFFVLASLYDHLSAGKKNMPSKWKKPLIVLLVIFAAIISLQSFKAIKTWKDSESLWTNVVEVYPHQSTGWYNLGHYLSETKKYDRSIPAFTKAIEIRKGYYEALYNRAQAYRLSGKDKEAIADYTAAISIKSTEPNPYMNRATSYFNTKEFDKALADFDKAVQLAPQDHQSWFGRGNAYFYMKQFDKALADYNKTLEVAPEFADGYYNRSIAFGNLGDKKRSLEDLLKSEQLGKPRDQAMMDWLNK